MFHKRLLKEFKDCKKYIGISVIMQWFMLLLNMFFLYETGKMIEQIGKGEMDETKMGVYLAEIVVVIALRSVCTRLNGMYSYKASSTVKKRLRNILTNKIFRVGMDYLQYCSSSEITQLSTEGVDQMEVYFGKYIPQFFYAMIAPLTLFVVVAGIYLPAAIVLLVCVPLIPIAIVVVQKLAKKILEKYWGKYTNLGDHFLENLQGLTTMKIYQADEYYAQKMHKESEDFRKITMGVLVMQLNSISVMDLVAYGGAAIGMIISILGFQNQAITISQCFFITMVSSEFFLPMRLLGSFFHIAMNGNAAADRIFKVLDIPEKKETDSTEVEGIQGDILLQDVSFSYEKERKVLKEITFAVRSHEMTAFVGTSGSGKSTLGSLLMGEHREYDGQILFGKKEQKSMDSSLCRKKITRITHDSYLFAGTLWDNLFMGMPSEKKQEWESSPTLAKKEEIQKQMIQALQKVQIYDFVKSAGGLEMEIKENASNLSGGQKQRIALARAILRDSEVYLFDEATSNIDVESEEKIMEVIKELGREKTVIVISHRLQNIVEADHIIMLEEGVVKEEGTHEQLMANQGAYQKLYQKQQELESYIHVAQDTVPDKREEGEGKERKIEREETQSGRKRSSRKIMFSLIKLVKPLTGYMLLAILLGCAGHMAATFLTITSVYGMKQAAGEMAAFSLTGIFVLLLGLGVVRGILRYIEQACNHFIAFKILAVIRDKIFGVLRKLAPAKLEGRKKGDFIAMITSDTELLEVFYAHTISPIAIAIITTIIMVGYIGKQHIWLGITALVFYGITGVVIPMINSKIGSRWGMGYRQESGKVNSVVLDNLRGVREILQFEGEKQRKEVTEISIGKMGNQETKLKRQESIQTAMTNGVIMAGGLVMLLAGAYFVGKGRMDLWSLLLSVVAMLSSFGPTAAISSLSNNLNQTLASGERILNLMEEKPLVEEVQEGLEVPWGNISMKNVDFSYPGQEEKILTKYSQEFAAGKITGIIGKSGCGKSTILKLLMRFFEVSSGEILYGNAPLQKIQTNQLRHKIAYVTQETYLFHDTIENNLRIAKRDASRKELEEACRKASIHTFICNLPKGYETTIEELGTSLSGGERQRLGIARAFLSGSDIILLDEPTSNLDSMNEAVILRALKEEAKEKTIIIVSHRKSTMGIADRVISL